MSQTDPQLAATPDAPSASNASDIPDASDVPGASDASDVPGAAAAAPAAADAPVAQDEAPAALAPAGPAPVGPALPPPAPVGAPAPDAAQPLLTASGLALRTRQGRVFGPVDWTLPAGAHGAVLGVQGSGRSSLLLALAGRMRGVTGALRVGDVDGIRRPRQLRHRTAVARITDLVELEPTLTIAETCAERALAEGISSRRGRATFAELAAAVGVHPDPGLRVDELPAFERTLLVAVLGCLRPASFVVLDDVDASLTVEQLAAVWDALDVLGQRGHRFVVSALTSTPVPVATSVLRLDPPETPDGLALSFSHLHARPHAQES